MEALRLNRSEPHRLKRSAGIVFYRALGLSRFEPHGFKRLNGFSSRRLERSVDFFIYFCSRSGRTVFCLADMKPSA